VGKNCQFCLVRAKLELGLIFKIKIKIANYSFKDVTQNQVPILFVRGTEIETHVFRGKKM
jgi:hypothetical protein